MSAPLHATLASAFWGAEQSSAAVPDGAVRSLPFAPPPLTQLLPSGLSRPQQLHMLQRFFNVPATPSFDSRAGGVVLDRVCAALGGASWWATATARLRAQAAWNMPLTREGKPHRALCDPSVYGVGARCRVALPRSTVLRGTASVDSLRAWLPAGDAAAGGAAAGGAGSGGARAPLRCRVSVVSQGLLPAHDVALDATWHERAAGAGGAYAEVPRAAALSVASRRRGPLRYRAGLVTSHGQATSAGGAAATPTPPAGVWDGFGPLHAQAGAVLGGQLAFLPRQPAAAPDGVRRWPKPKRREYSAMPQRAQVTVGAWAGGVARAPLRRTPAAVGVEHFAFASAAAGVQVGTFSRALLDYTALSFRADVSTASGGLAAAAAAAGGPAALARAATGASASSATSGSITAPPLGCHVTLSAAQQLLGPVRLRADLRLSAAAAAAACHAALGRPATPGSSFAPLEAVYGVDVALPAVMGAARVVAWMCPQRGEALAELRFLET